MGCCVCRFACCEGVKDADSEVRIFAVLTSEVCISELHTSELGPGGASVAFSIELELFGLVEPTEFEVRMGKCPKEAYVTDDCFQHASCMPWAGLVLLSYAGIQITFEIKRNNFHLM